MNSIKKNYDLQTMEVIRDLDAQVAFYIKMFRIKNQDSVGKTIKMDMQLRLDRAKLKSPQTIEKLCSKKKQSKFQFTISDEASDDKSCAPNSYMNNGFENQSSRLVKSLLSVSM